LPKGDLSSRIRPEFEQQLAVKFVDQVRARAAVDGSVASLAGSDLSAAARVAQTHRLRFSKLIGLPDEDLLELEDRAARHSGVAQPDLAGIMIVELTDGTVKGMLAAGNALQDLAEVEYADILTLNEPPPSHDPAPPTASFVEAIAKLKVLSSACRFRRGDANDSGMVDVGDCSYITSWLCCGGPAPLCKEAADANDNGSNEPADATFVCNWLFSGGPAPPAPGPFTCGPDPVSSPENLGCGKYSSCP
jgi:hypothetical protein